MINIQELHRQPFVARISFGRLVKTVKGHMFVQQNWVHLLTNEISLNGSPPNGMENMMGYSFGWAASFSEAGIYMHGHPCCIGMMVNQKIIVPFTEQLNLYDILK